MKRPGDFPWLCEIPRCGCGYCPGMKCACKCFVLFGCVCPLICSGSLWSFISQSKANMLLLKWSMLLGIKYLILLASSALCLSSWLMATLYHLNPKSSHLCSCLMRKLCCTVWCESPCHISHTQTLSQAREWGRMNVNESSAGEICLSPPCQGLAKCLDAHEPWKTSLLEELFDSNGAEIQGLINNGSCQVQQLWEQ